MCQEHQELLTLVDPSVSHLFKSQPELTSPHQLAVDKRYQAACPKVLYRADDDRPVFPNIYLDQVDHKHVYVAFQNQVGGWDACRWEHCVSGALSQSVVGVFR